jgi:hypothetical protein
MPKVECSIEHRKLRRGFFDILLARMSHEGLSRTRIPRDPSLDLAQKFLCSEFILNSTQSSEVYIPAAGRSSLRPAAGGPCLGIAAAAPSGPGGSVVGTTVSRVNFTGS